MLEARINLTPILNQIKTKNTCKIGAIVNFTRPVFEMAGKFGNQKIF